MMNDKFSDQDLAAAVGNLPTHDIDARSSERMRLQAQAVLTHERCIAGRPQLASLARAWRQVLEPTLTTATVAIYLAWMLGALQIL